LKAFANEVIRVLRARCPNLIYEQILRVDFFQYPDTGTYYLNEIEGNVDKITDKM
jgi:D-alanine-D-alanine ligase-like ATP-grasp enzyme